MKKLYMHSLRMNLQYVFVNDMHTAMLSPTIDVQSSQPPWKVVFLHISTSRFMMSGTDTMETQTPNPLLTHYHSKEIATIVRK